MTLRKIGVELGQIPAKTTSMPNSMPQLIMTSPEKQKWRDNMTAFVNYNYYSVNNYLTLLTTLLLSHICEVLERGRYLTTECSDLHAQ